MANISLKKLFPNATKGNIIEILLKKTGHDGRHDVQPVRILDFLGLRHKSMDLSKLSELEEEQSLIRALLDYEKKLIITDVALEKNENRLRFSVFHEVGHYVLPDHQDTFYLCSQRSIFEDSHNSTEKEANSFAADLMFHGSQFSLFSNEMQISASTVKKLSNKYKASIEATCRHMVEKSLKPVLLVVYEKKPVFSLEHMNQSPLWDVKYDIPSPLFREQYGVSVSRDPGNEIVQEIGETYCDIENTRTDRVIASTNGKNIFFECEYFTNYHNVFRIMRPLSGMKAV